MCRVQISKDPVRTLTLDMSVQKAVKPEEEKRLQKKRDDIKAKQLERVRFFIIELCLFICLLASLPFTVRLLLLNFKHTQKKACEKLKKSIQNKRQ